MFNDHYGLLINRERGLILALLHLRKNADLKSFSINESHRKSIYKFERKITTYLKSNFCNKIIFTACDFLVSEGLLKNMRNGEYALTENGWFWSNFIIEYFSQIEGGYLSLVLNWLDFKRYFSNQKNISILDVGCGCGVTSIALSSTLKEIDNIRYWGVDVELKNIEIANELFFKQEGMSFSVHDVDKGLPGAPNDFDLIVSRGVLLYINPKVFFEEAAIKLKTNGILFVQTPSWPHFSNLIMKSVKNFNFRQVGIGIVALNNWPNLSSGKRLLNCFPWSPSLWLIHKFIRTSGLIELRSGHVKDLPYADCGSVLAFLAKKF